MKSSEMRYFNFAIVHDVEKDHGDKIGSNE